FLEIRDLAAAYGDVQALWKVSLTVGQGEIVALIGANGAGKTTTLRAVSGLVRILGGSIRLEGQELAGREPSDIVERGVAHVPEGVTVLLVEQNVEQALALAYRAYVLETGSVALSGTGHELLGNDAVRKTYLGVV